MAKRLTAVYTLAHLCVDFGCHYAFFALFLPGLPVEAALGALIYNALAFALQPFIGVWYDGRRSLPLGAAGCALTAVGVVGAALAPWLGLVLCGLGNALFHVGGGSDVLVVSNGKMAHNGIFVASGALGVALGAMAASGGMSLWLPVGAAAGCAVLVWRLERPRHSGARPFGAVSGVPAGLVIALCALLVVIRAYGGGIVPKMAAVPALLPVLAAVLGKGAGGLLADRLGARRVGAASLAAAALLLGALPPHPGLWLAGLFCFNLCMPITLCALSDCLPGHPGLAFGLTTLGLFAGWLPVAFWGAPEAARWWVLGLSLLSALCLFIAAGNKKEAVL